MRRHATTSTMLAIAGLAALALGGAGPASAVAGDAAARQSAKIDFTSERSAGSSGLKIDFNYRNPDDPEAKPPAVRQVVIRLPRGSAIDTSVPARCAATDPELISMGESACPAGSIVGDGFLLVDTGFPEPDRRLEQDVSLINDEDELILLTQDRDTGARLASHAQVDGRVFRTMVPPLPGGPPDGGAIDLVRERIDPVSDAGRHYITTPSRCPQRGFWRQHVKFTYADGVSQTEANRSPCRPGGGR